MNLPHAQRFPFAFSPSYRLPALIFGITPKTAWVEVSENELKARFGPWSLRTSLSNISGTEESSGFAYLRTAGPAHLSLKDRGVTFASNGDRGICVKFHEPVRTLDPTGRLRHPGATFTVTDPTALQHALDSARS